MLRHQGQFKVGTEIISLIFVYELPPNSPLWKKVMAWVESN